VTRLLVSARIAPFSESPRHAARHGQAVVERDATWYESFGPGAWLLGGREAQVQIGHGTRPVGSVVVLAARDRWWFADMTVESDDAQVLEAIQVGAAISIGFDPVDHVDDGRTHVRQHRIARLKHGQVPGYVGAAITAVSESKAKPSGVAVRDSATTATKPGVDWRSQLPLGYAAFRDYAGELEVGDELLLGHRRSGARWDGSRFHVGAARLAA